MGERLLAERLVEKVEREWRMEACAVKIWTPWLLEVGAWLAPIWEPRWKQLSPNATMAPQKKLKVELARRTKARPERRNLVKEEKEAKKGRHREEKEERRNQEKAEREENAHPTMRLSAKLILRPQMSSASWRRW